MNQKEYDETKKKVLEMKLSDLDKFLAERPDGTNGLQEMVAQIKADAELQIRVAEYIEARILGADHQGAVKLQNDMIRSVRKAMGKIITRDVNF